MKHDIIHRIPAGDVIIHEHNEDCPCGPTARLTQRPGRTDLWIYDHHALAVTPNRTKEGKRC